MDETRVEVVRLQNKNRKLLTMNGGQPPREDCINQARLSLERYVQSSEEQLVKAVREEDTGSQETATSFKASRRA